MGEMEPGQKHSDIFVADKEKEMRTFVGAITAGKTLVGLLKNIE